MKRPALSVIVIFYDMRREARRTLHTLSADYQVGVCESDYQVIAIDNGSNEPLNRDWIAEFGSNFEYHFFETESRSPVEAVNFGARRADTNFIAVIVDGARMVTPGIIRESLNALNENADSFVSTLAWHLGPEVQNSSMQNGYDQLVEDRLLDSIDWRHHGYRLFEISTLAQSSRVNIPGPMPYECSWLAMQRGTFLALGGFDENFQSPGGGLMNHDFLNRALSRPGVDPVIILSEGNFHQIHGGIATNVPMELHPIAKFREEYQAIRGNAYQHENSARPRYVGDLPLALKRHLIMRSKGFN